MFEVTLMVEDNKLGKVMWALDGLVVGIPAVLPVRGAVTAKSSKGTKVKAAPETRDGNINSRFTELVAKRADQELTTSQFADLMEKAGGARISAAASITRLKEQGMIQRSDHGRWKVTVAQR